jgi:hypothetical protein
MGGTRKREIRGSETDGAARRWSALESFRERAFQGDSNVHAMRQTLAERLFDLFQRTSGPEWPWFEDRLTYCNARLSHALIVSGAWLEHAEMIAAGTQSLAWLASTQCSTDGYFAPIGSNGFYGRGGLAARRGVRDGLGLSRGAAGDSGPGSGHKRGARFRERPPVAELARCARQCVAT